MRRIEFWSRLPSLNAVWMKLPCVEIRSQSEPKWPSTTFSSVGSPRMHMSATPAVRDEVARAGRVATVLGALRLAVLRLLDLAADRRHQHVALQPHAASRSARTAST